MPEISPDRGTIHCRVQTLENIVAQCTRALDQQMALNVEYARYVEELEAKQLSNRDRKCGMLLYCHPSKPLVLPWTVLFSMALLPVMWYLWRVAPAPDLVAIAGAQADVSFSLAYDYPSILLAVVDKAYALMVAFLYAEDIIVDIPVFGPVATCMQDNRFFTVALMLGFFLGSWITALVLLVPGSQTIKKTTLLSNSPSFELPPALREWVQSVDTDKDAFVDYTAAEGDVLSRGLSFEDAEVDADISAGLSASVPATAAMYGYAASAAEPGVEMTYTSQVFVSPASESEVSGEKALSQANYNDIPEESGSAAAVEKTVSFGQVEVEEDEDAVQVAVAALEELFSKREYTVAIDLCKEVLTLVGEAPVLYIYLTKALYYLGKQSPSENKSAVLEETVVIGEKALALTREGGNDVSTLITALKWAAIAHNEIAGTKSLQEKLQHYHILYTHLTEALSLTNQDATLLMMMGRYAMGIAKLSWLERTAAKAVFGTLPSLTYQDACAHFQRAAALKPDWLLNLLWLGRSLVALGDHEAARGYFRRVASHVAEGAEESETVADAAKELAALE